MKGTELKKVMSQVDKYTSIAGAKKATRDKLIKELEVSKKKLTETAQEELKLQSTSDENKEKIRDETAKQLIHYLKENKLPTPKPGNWADQSELVIYIYELQALTKETQEKLQYLT